MYPFCWKRSLPPASLFTITHNMWSVTPKKQQQKTYQSKCKHSFCPNEVCVWSSVKLDVWYIWEVFHSSYKIDTNFNWRLKIKNIVFSPALVDKFPGWCKCHGKHKRASRWRLYLSLPKAAVQGWEVKWNLFTGTSPSLFRSNWLLF